MVIMQMYPERNLFKYLFFFLGEGLQPGGHFFLFTGKWAYNWGAYNGGRVKSSSLC